jgi:hypothetical protein
MKQRDPAFAADWLSDMLADGQLAAAAWAGYVRLPKNGLYRILEEVEATRGGALAARAQRSRRRPAPG